VTVLPSAIAPAFHLPALDNRAALCPDCRHYLVRGRVNLQQTSFFVERCPNCKGYWCDGGEWGVLQQLSLHTHLSHIFADSWQAQVKALEAAQRERQATMDKLGPEIAAKIFELADVLEQHPNGDFGVAYLMRRFEE
jgi:Zn-finger nucleic acid-binding protein